MPHPFIILGLDIDDTIITSKIRDRLVFIGDKTEWIKAIKELKEYCQERGVTLIPQLITAKSDGNTDSTVDAIMGQMREVFPPLDSNGNSKDLRLAHQYMATRHIPAGKIMNAYNNLDPSVCVREYRSTDALDLREAERTTISPVHVVQGNYNGETSKAHVLHHISSFFGGVDNNNVFLVDDADYNETNLRDRCGDPSVSQYQFIQAGNSKVIETFVSAVRRRADEIAAARVVVETEQVEQPPAKKNKANNIDVASLKEAVWGYLKHLEAKLKDHNVEYNQKEIINIPTEAVPLISKLMTRYNAIFQLHATIQYKETLDDDDVESAKSAVICCTKNKPEWLERPFLQKLTDVLSLGLKPLYRAYFSKEATAQETIENTVGPQAGA